jgi:hypothetical protein
MNDEIVKRQDFSLVGIIKIEIDIGIAIGVENRLF